METVISAHEYKLAMSVFKAERIKAARKKVDPVAYLVKGCLTSGLYSPIEIFAGCHGYEIKGEAVTCFGVNADGRLDLQKPIYRSTLTRLANIALVGVYQESFLEMVQ